MRRPVLRRHLERIRADNVRIMVGDLPLQPGYDRRIRASFGAICTDDLVSFGCLSCPSRAATAALDVDVRRLGPVA